MIQRLKNLWALSRFKITEFDNKLVITKVGKDLVFARPATIVQDNPLQEELEQDHDKTD